MKEMLIRDMQYAATIWAPSWFASYIALGYWLKY